MAEKPHPSRALVPRNATWLVFPLLILLVTVVLGSLELSGSSVSRYDPSGGKNGLLAGRARPVRTDEWFVRTPLLARQAALDLPEHDVIGVGEHDMAVGNDLPTRGWEVLVRPHTLPYHGFGFARAFAFEWWILFLALPAIGLYFLAVALGVRILTASLIALIVVLSPVVQWWTVPATGTTIGYACLAGAALVTAARARRLYARTALAALAGWLGACLVLTLYPPWAVPMGLLVSAVAIAAVAVRLPPPGERRPWCVGLVIVGAVAAVVAGALVLAFFVAHRDAFDALANSIYPGRRRSAGGAGDLAVLLGAPFDLVESTASRVTVEVNGLNQSEAAAGLFTLLAIATALVAGRRASASRGRRSRAVLLTILGVGAVFVVWYLLPVPAAIGRLFLLDRVRSERMLLPLAAASALALGIFVDTHRGPGSGLERSRLAAGTVAFAVPTIWAGWNLDVDGKIAPRWQVLLLAAAAVTGVGFALSGRRAGLWLLAAMFAVGAATVNPLQHGVSPLVDSPGATLGRELRSRPDAGTVLYIAAGRTVDLDAQAELTASGVPFVSGVNNSPNATAWRVLDPDGSSRTAWDRYNIAVWIAGAPGSAPRFELDPPATLTVTVDPCDARLAMLNVSTVVSDHELPHPCLAPVRAERGPQLFAYRVVRPASALRR
ncbi:MAG TPA: hypothetical protein VG348_09830 [Acidimicrobiia bacterium]|nr:hypothetical protein [Acidimicrobiia bacterium]